MGTEIFDTRNSSGWEHHGTANPSSTVYSSFLKNSGILCLYLCGLHLGHLQDLVKDQKKTMVSNYGPLDQWEKKKGSYKNGGMNSCGNCRLLQIPFPFTKDTWFNSFASVMWNKSAATALKKTIKNISINILPTQEGSRISILYWKQRT